MLKHINAEWLIRQIAEGDSCLDAASIAQLENQMGVSLTEKSWFCIAVHCAGPNRGLDAALMEKLFSVCRSTKRIYPGRIFCYVGSNFHVTMLVTDENDRAELAQAIYHYVAKKMEYPVQLGVGRSYSQIERLSYSRVEAHEALNALERDEKVSYIEDIYLSRNITAGKLEGRRGKIVDLFKRGQLDQMTELTEELAEEARQQSPVRPDAPYPTSIRRVILEVLIEIMHIAADMNVDVDQVLEHQDPYSRIFEFRSTPEILAWFKQTTETLYTSIEEQTGKTQSNMLRIAKNFIDEHLCEPELSLSLVSQELGITATYFSAFFIREMGMGFNEYITGLRMERAKQMLVQTNMKVGQIAEACGFRSSSYFTVVFRKQMDMSPGDFRNKK